MSVINPVDMLLPPVPYGVAYQEFVVDNTTFQAFGPDTCLLNSRRISVWFPVRLHTEAPQASYHLSDCSNGSDTGIPVPPASLPQLAVISGVSAPAPIAVDGTNLVPAPNKKQSKNKCKKRCNRPFPVILRSHGTQSMPWFGSIQPERLASYGFIVFAPVHAGNSFKDALFQTSVPDPTFSRRIADLQFTLDWIVRLDTTAGNKFFRRLDLDRIGFQGFSRGAETFLNWLPTPSLIKAAHLGQPNISPTNVPYARLPEITIPIFLEAGSDTSAANTPIPPNSPAPPPINNNRDAISEFPIFSGLGTAPQFKWLQETQGERHLSNADPCGQIQFYFQPLVDALVAAGFGTSFQAIVITAGATAPNSQYNVCGCTYFNANRPLTTQQAADIFTLYLVVFLKVFVERQEQCWCDLLSPAYAVHQQLPSAYYHNGSIVISPLSAPVSVTSTANPLPTTERPELCDVCPPSCKC